jgi:hypothetical protein
MNPLYLFSGKKIDRDLCGELYQKGIRCNFSYVEYLSESDKISFKEIKDIKEIKEKDADFDYDKLTGNKIINDNRIIFYASQTAKNKPDIFTQVLNGLIVDSETNKIINIPSVTLNNHPNDNLVDRYINQDLYEMFAATDGSLINLYYWPREDKWVLSTIRGMEVNNVPFLTSKITYQQAFDDCLRGVGTSYEELCNVLSKECCYVFDITHPLVHPYWRERKVVTPITLIQIANVETGDRFYEWEELNEVTVKIPLQQPISWSYTGKKKSKLSIKSIRKYCNNHTTFWKPNAPIPFGIIFRSRDPDETKEMSSIFIPSILYTNINRVWYERDLFPFLPTDNRYKREKFVTLYNFLDRSLRPIATGIFPQLIKDFEEIESNIKRLVDETLLVFNQESKNTVDDLQSLEDTRQHKSIISCSTKTAVIRYVIEDIRKKISSDEDINEQIISNYYHEPCLIEVLYNIVFP